MAKVQVDHYELTDEIWFDAGDRFLPYEGAIVPDGKRYPKSGAVDDLIATAKLYNWPIDHGEISEAAGLLTAAINTRPVGFEYGVKVDRAPDGRMFIRVKKARELTPVIH